MSHYRLLLTFLLFIIFLFIKIPLKCQTIHGEVYNKQGEAIDIANIFFKIDVSTITEFTLLKNGKFSITLNAEYPNKVIVEVDAYGFKKAHKIIDKPLKGNIYYIDFELEEFQENLEEVIITAPQKAIVVKNDTVSYSLNAYINGDEEKVQDILKKLPGISINEDSGLIKFKGKEVQALLLDGDDLFGSSYSLGSKNINANVIEQVQAIENYSSNSLLKGIEDDEKVAINLGLKKGLFDFSGNIDVGVGLFDNLDLARIANATLLGVTKGYKSFAVINANNLGVDNSPYNHFGSKGSNRRLSESDYFIEKIIPITRFSSFLDDDRVNNNNQLYGSYNAIVKLSDKFNFKTNLNYSTDHLRNRRFAATYFNFEDEQFVTEDDIFYNNSPVQFHGDAEIKYAISDSAVFYFTSKFQKEDIKSNIEIASNNDNSYQSNLRSNDFFNSNQIEYTKRFSANRALQIAVYSTKNDVNQQYQIITQSDLRENTNLQDISIDREILGGTISFLGSQSNGNAYSLFLKTHSIEYRLASRLRDISNENGIRAENDIVFQERNLNQGGTYNISIGKLKISPKYSFGIAKNIINAADSVNTMDRTNFVVKNELNLKYKLNDISAVHGSFTHELDSKVEKYLFTNAILINNRTVITNTPSLENQEYSTIGLRYSMYNLYSQTTLNIGINYFKNMNGFFMDSFINENEILINNI